MDVLKNRELEEVVDEMFERSDAEAFRLMHLIADVAIHNTEDELTRSQARLLSEAA